MAKKNFYWTLVDENGKIVVECGSPNLYTTRRDAKSEIGWYADDYEGLKPVKCKVELI